MHDTKHKKQRGRKGEKDARPDTAHGAQRAGRRHTGTYGHSTARVDHHMRISNDGTCGHNRQHSERGVW